MSKDPAFLFYPNDYLGGTMGMTFEEKGAYMELLMMQFNRGHMTSHMIGQTIGQLWVNIQDKFTKDDKGLYYNKRLEIEQNKRKAFTDSRKNNVKGKNQYSKPIKKTGHMTSHMEDVNENRNRNRKENRTITFPFTSKSFYETWELWKEYRTENGKKQYKAIGEQGALTEVSNLANGNENKAIEIIMQSIKKGWTGFFNLNNNTKNNNNGIELDQDTIDWLNK